MAYTYPPTLAEARDWNTLRYGPPEKARDYADDIGAGYCETCNAVYEYALGYVNDGHQCLEDGTTDRYLLSE